MRDDGAKLGVSKMPSAPKSRRTVIVGDVHGCIDELERLLSTIGLGSDDRLVLVGDLVAKGPESVAVLRLARSLGAESTLGNHDDALLALHPANEARDADVSDMLRKIARKLDDADWDWLHGLPLTIALPEHGALVVHAGVVPGVPIDQQKREDLLTMRSIRPDGTATRRIEQGVPWARMWMGPPHVYFGHDAVRGLQRYEHATGLDTACVYGGRLTACVLPERELVWVRAKRTYAEPGKTIAARNAKKK